MEAPRISRVGNTLAEHGNLVFGAALALSLGAMAKVVLNRLPAAQEAAERSASQANPEANVTGGMWQDLTEADFQQNAA